MHGARCCEITDLSRTFPHCLYLNLSNLPYPQNFCISGMQYTFDLGEDQEGVRKKFCVFGIITVSKLQKGYSLLERGGNISIRDSVYKDGE